MTEPSARPCSADDLAARQAALVAALVAGGELPAGLDGARVRATRHALLVKRAGEVAVAWPLLATSFGAEWPARFITWAHARPPLGPLRDGRDFARALADAGELPELARTELTEREGSWPRLRRYLRRVTRPAS
ncbi:MAG: hypothetical protein ACRDRX_17375 [Pseudonocardiaceae bacterium]